VKTGNGLIVAGGSAPNGFDSKKVVVSKIKREGPARTKRLKRKKYDAELLRLQHELVKLAAWVKHRGLRVVVLFEGRDAAGKGGAIKRITEAISPRLCHVVALTAPT